MKLLFLLPILTYRGSEQVVSQLVNYLRSQGHSITIITPYKDDTISIPQANIIHPGKAIMLLCKNPFLYIFIAPVVLLIYSLRNIKKTDLIITDNFPCLQIATLLSILFKKNFILSIHGIETNTSPEQSMIEKIHHHIVTNLNKVTNRYVKKIIVNSPKVQRNAKIIWPKAEIKILIPPVSLSPVENSPPSEIRKRYNISDNQILVSVGVLHPLKNQTLLVKVLATITQIYPHIVLMLIGDGNKQPIHALAQSLGVQKNILFTGFVSHKNIHAYYEAADILLQPAFYPEGLSLTVFEAMLAKKLAICAEGAGAADIIREQNIGIVADPTPEKFAAEILKYLANPAEYEPIINRGYEYVQKNLTLIQYGKLFENEINATISDTQ